MSEAQKRRAPGRSLAVIEAELREDEETQKIAEVLGLPLDEYISMVMEYVKDPNKEAEVTLYSEEELEMVEGERPATIKEIDDWLTKVESGDIKLGPKEIGETEWDDEGGTAAETLARKAAGQARQINAPKEGEKQAKVLVEDNATGNLLKNQLMREAQNARTVRRGTRKKPKPTK